MKVRELIKKLIDVDNLDSEVAFCTKENMKKEIINVYG